MTVGMSIAFILLVGWAMKALVNLEDFPEESARRRHQGRNVRRRQVPQPRLSSFATKLMLFFTCSRK